MLNSSPADLKETIKLLKAPTTRAPLPPPVFGGGPPRATAASAQAQQPPRISIDDYKVGSHPDQRARLTGAAAAAEPPPPPPQQRKPQPRPSPEEADCLLDLLNCTQHSRRSTSTHLSTSSWTPSSDADDTIIIGVLNGGSRRLAGCGATAAAGLATSCSDESAAAEETTRHGAATCIQRHFRGYAVRVRAAAQQQARLSAACCIQSQWRRRAAAELMRAALHQDKCARIIQTCWRRRRTVLQARSQQQLLLQQQQATAAARLVHQRAQQQRQQQLQQLQQLRLQHHAAAIIQQHFRAWRHSRSARHQRRRQAAAAAASTTKAADAPCATCKPATVKPAWVLSPLKVRPSDLRPSSGRSDADAGDSGQDDDARWHRTVVATRQRALELDGAAAAQRSGLNQRIMVASSQHRTQQEVAYLALNQIASGSNGCSPRLSSQPSPAVAATAASSPRRPILVTRGYAEATSAACTSGGLVYGGSRNRRQS